MVSVPSSVGDSKLKVASLPLETEMPIVTIDGEQVSYEEAREAIATLPSIVTTKDSIELSISSRTKKKLKNELSKNRYKEYYFSALSKIEDVIAESVLLEEHRDRVKQGGERNSENPSDANIEKIQRFYGALQIGDKTYRVKTTAIVPTSSSGKMHNYEVTKIELLPPIANVRQNAPTAVENNSTKAKELLAQNSATPNNGMSQTLNSSSISLTKLIEGVELSYEKGKLLSDAMREAQRRKDSKPQDKATIDRLIDCLTQSNLAKSVVVDKDAFDKKIEEVDHKARLMKYGCLSMSY